MKDNFKKIGARVYLYKKNALIKKITYVYEDGTESEPLSRFIHLGMFTDSILFGDECQSRFFVYPFSLRLYDTDVDNCYPLCISTARTKRYVCLRTSDAPHTTDCLKSSNRKAQRLPVTYRPQFSVKNITEMYVVFVNCCTDFVQQFFWT